MKTETYFNTTNETEAKVIEYRKINNGQDKKVLTIIRELNKPFSASQIWKLYIHKHVSDKTPITSSRRSINTLKNAGFIEETGKRVQGIYGRNEKQYKISKL